MAESTSDAESQGAPLARNGEPTAAHARGKTTSLADYDPERMKTPQRTPRTPGRQCHVAVLGLWCLMLAGAVFYLGALSVKDGHVPAKAIPFAGPFVPLILGTQLNWYVALASVMAVVGGCAALARKRTLPRLAGAMVGTGSWIGIGIVQLYRWL